MKLSQLQNYFREEEELFRNYSPDNMRPKQKIMPDTTEDLKDLKDLKDHPNGDNG